MESRLSEIDKKSKIQLRLNGIDVQIVLSGHQNVQGHNRSPCYECHYGILQCKII